MIIKVLKIFIENTKVSKIHKNKHLYRVSGKCSKNTESLLKKLQKKNQRVLLREKLKRLIKKSNTRARRNSLKIQREGLKNFYEIPQKLMLGRNIIGLELLKNKSKSTSNTHEVPQKKIFIKHQRLPF